MSWDKQSEIDHLRKQLQQNNEWIEDLEEENERLHDALKEAYRLVDMYYADMTEEASDDLEQHFLSVLNQ